VGDARLLRDEDVIAELKDVRPDMPWFEARFIPTEAFSDVAPLFRKEREVLESGSFDADEWEAVWERIWAAGISLALADGTRLDRDFAVHVYDDGTARFRYLRS
jgi:hypothetical protein